MSNLYASPILLSHSRSFARDEQGNPFASFQFPGDHTARVTPVPIPNTVVKPRRADDTARATVWERRSSPGLKSKGRSEQSDRPFCILYSCLFFAEKTSDGYNKGDYHGGENS